jgi:hypothetical protein
MSKVKRTITTSENKQIVMEFEKVVAVYDFDNLTCYKVPDSNHVQTIDGDIFVYDEHKAVPSGDMLICYYRSSKYQDFINSEMGLQNKDNGMLK